jgi:hypothetical protein
MQFGSVLEHSNRDEITGKSERIEPGAVVGRVEPKSLEGMEISAYDRFDMWV